MPATRVHARQNASWVSRALPSCLADRDVLPTADHPYGFCFGDSRFHNMTSPGWSTFVDKSMSRECRFTGSSTANTTTILPSPARATVYAVFAYARVPFAYNFGSHNAPEAHAQREMRRKLRRWTLSRLRKQFGASLELTVVQVDSSHFNVASDFGVGSVNRVISGTLSEWQDWAMYQEGLHAAWHRLARFEWVLLFNDQMVGPLASLPVLLSQLARAGAAIWGVSELPGCCIRGYGMAFSRQLVATESWRSEASMTRALASVHLMAIASRTVSDARLPLSAP